MMTKIQYYAIKLFWFFVHPMQVMYWFVFRPHVRGVKCLIEGGDGKILLLRLNYSHRHWVLPGGGVYREERYVDAAYRELKEETDITEVILERIGTYESTFEYKQVAVEVYAGLTRSQKITIDPIEIAACGWFPKDKLPEPIAPSVVRVLAMEKNLQKQQKTVSV